MLPIRNNYLAVRLSFFFLSTIFFTIQGFYIDYANSQSVEELLEQARLQIKENKLIMPINDNALNTLREILKLEPDNQEVPKLFKKIKARYIRWAERAEKQGKFSTAKIYYKRIIRIDPSDKEILHRLKILQRKEALKKHPTVPIGQKTLAKINAHPAKTDKKSLLKVDITRMTFIPEGQFLMGSNDIHPPNRRPAHRVYLKAFYIDTWEVTNDDMVKFLNSQGNPEGLYIKIGPENFIQKKQGKYFVIPNKEKYPANFVSWYGANAYCEWLGKSLPTEAQWEKAARGTDGRRYPWGSAPPSSRYLNFISFTNWQSVLKPVGSYEAGKSPYGVYDMAGNVWEWCSDWYNPSYYIDSPHKNPTGPEKGLHKVLRGGLFGENPLYVETSYRNHNKPELQGLYTGFRCAYEIP